MRKIRDIAFKAILRSTETQMIPKWTACGILVGVAICARKQKMQKKTHFLVKISLTLSKNIQRISIKIKKHLEQLIKIKSF